MAAPSTDGTIIATTGATTTSLVDLAALLAQDSNAHHARLESLCMNLDYPPYYRHVTPQGKKENGVEIPVQVVTMVWRRRRYDVRIPPAVRIMVQEGRRAFEEMGVCAVRAPQSQSQSLPLPLQGEKNKSEEDDENEGAIEDEAKEDDAKEGEEYKDEDEQDDGEQDDGEQDDGEQDDGEQDDGEQDDGEQDDGEQDDGEQDMDMSVAGRVQAKLQNTRQGFLCQSENSLAMATAFELVVRKLAPLSAQSVWHSPVSTPATIGDFFYPRRVYLDMQPRAAAAKKRDKKTTTTTTTTTTGENDNNKAETSTKWPFECRVLGRDEWLRPGVDGGPGAWAPWAFSDRHRLENEQQAAAPAPRDLAQEMFGWSFCRIVDADEDIFFKEVEGGAGSNNLTLPCSLLADVPRFDASTLLIDSADHCSITCDVPELTLLNEAEKREAREKVIEKLGRKGELVLERWNREEMYEWSNHEGHTDYENNDENYNENHEDNHEGDDENYDRKHEEHEDDYPRGPCLGCSFCMGGQPHYVVVEGEHLYHCEINRVQFARLIRLYRSPLVDKIRSVKLAGVVVAEVPKIKPDGTEEDEGKEVVVISLLIRTPQFPAFFPSKWCTQRKHLDEARIPAFKRREWIAQLREATALLHEVGIFVWPGPAQAVPDEETDEQAEATDEQDEQEEGQEDEEPEPEDDNKAYYLSRWDDPWYPLTEDMGVGVDTDGNAFVSTFNDVYPFISPCSVEQDWAALSAKALSWGVGTAEDERVLAEWGIKTRKQDECEFEAEEWDGDWGLMMGKIWSSE